MLVELPSNVGPAEMDIVASDWTYDAVRNVGQETIARIALSSGFMGTARAIWQPGTRRTAGGLRADEAERLRESGHAEIASARLRAGMHSYCIIFSASQASRLDAARFCAAQMMIVYALSAMSEQLGADAAGNPLTDRERECLVWVAEGKTASEVATILGVSCNTVNGYLTQAMRKLSACNRAMAIATAIRNGII